MSDFPIDETDLTWLARLARALLRESSAVDDLVQETVMATLEKPIPEGAPRRAWLGSIARRLAARRFRDRARRTRREKRVARPEAIPDSTELVERAEIAEQLTAAARQLPEPFRRTILLRFLEGLSPDEIAEQEKRPADTVRWRLRRGLELLREELVRRHRRDWSSWRLLLAPLSRSADESTFGVLGSPRSPMNSCPVPTLSKLKATLLGCVFVGGTGALLLWQTTSEEAPNTKPAQEPAQLGQSPLIEQAQSTQSALIKPMTDSPTTGDSLVTTEFEPGRSSNPKHPSLETTVRRTDLDLDLNGLVGRVTDSSGTPIEGATVYLTPSSEVQDRPGPRDRSETPAQAQTNSLGHFNIPEHDYLRTLKATRGTLDLGVTANGFLRRHVLGISERTTRKELIVVLEKGRRISGRVLDEFGVPVPDLELLAHTVYAGVQHVSPSQIMIRSSLARLGDARSRYHQCLARTDENGEVVFSGLSEGDFSVLSLDPGWVMLAPTSVSVDELGVIWTAYQGLGVRLTVIHRTTGLPVELASATFRVKLTFVDGETRDLGQWVGRGRGEVSFSLDPKEFLREDQSLARAVFSGTVRVGELEVPWESDPLEKNGELRGVAEVRVEVDSSPGEKATAEKSLQVPRDAELELEITYPDGTLTKCPIVLQWNSLLENGQRRRGSVHLEADPPGRYLTTIPTGLVDLRIEALHASGSLPAWQGQVRGSSAIRTLARVTLSQGGRVAIERPGGWSGEWKVYASYRNSSDGDWHGSWTYSTLEAALFLVALRPAEWRFQIFRGERRSSEPVTRIVRILANEETLVSAQ